MPAAEASSVVPASDNALAQVLRDLAASGAKVMVVTNAYTARIAADDGTGAWKEVARGDFGLKSGAAAQPIADAANLAWCEVPGALAAMDVATAVGSPVDATFVDAWLAAADALTGSDGRGASPAKDDLNHLGYLAGWRCQFSGCGKDLRRESLSGTHGNFSYFAHIIASSAKGPRGDALLSGQRSSDIDNIMLMCDECHRRIDRVDPDRFTVDVLNKMRQDSINEVRRLLNTLQYPEVLPLVIMGNITAQSPRFNQRDAEEAMWTRQLRMASGGPERYLSNEGRLHDPHSPTYWGTAFNSLAEDLPMLRKRLNGTLKDDGTRMPVAVFPLHGTSFLTLAGRVVGEGTKVTVFQFNRDRPAGLPGGPWAFDENTPAPAPGKYTATELAPHAGGNEACLIVSLTFGLAPERLPPSLYADGAFKVGAMHVTTASADDLKHSVFSHTSDIDLFALAVEDAIRTLQDKWRVSTIHLFIGAPASACFKVGQKLQARNHAKVICYESKPGANGPFLPTIAIANTTATELQTHQSISLV